MAPTEILAEQHYASLTKLFSPLNIKVDLLTGSHRPRADQPRAGNPILVGTHALLEKKVALANVRLVIIDEQHRFGVRQRALLREKGKTPHVLTMTATPIPRTQMLVFYGDLDLSTIDEMPPGRKLTKTWVVPPEKRASAYVWIRKQVQNSVKFQAFIICPFIEPSETLTSVKAASAEYHHLQKNIFPDLKLGLLHGNMKSRQKEQILSDFRLGKFAILVSTPVVEVGIDIPTASIILIEAAERFGLAQLHQLRGRVGRAGQQGFCLLFLGNYSVAAFSRLKNLEKNTSGANLAELDLKIRGPGAVYGTLQHGREELKVASFTDTQLLENARSEAVKLINTDADFKTFPALKARLKSGTIAEVTPD